MERPNTSLSSFFDWVLETSIMASMLVGLILCMKVILQNKLSPRWHYMLWLVIIARLLLPWAPESSYSLYNLLLYGREALRTADTQVKAPAESPIQTSVQNTAISTAPLEVNQEPQASVSTLEEKQPSASFSLYEFALYVWLSGVVCIGFLTIVANRRVYISLRKQPVITDARIVALFEQCRKNMSIKPSIPLVTAGNIPSPAVLGCIRPRVLLSDFIMRTLDDHQLRYIFYHELAHVKRKDVAANWLMNSLVILHWFNPILWYAFSRMREDQEIACDALALTFIGSEQKEKYGYTIISLLEHYSKRKPMPGLATLTGGKKQMKRRIMMIKSFQKKSYRWSALGLASLITLSSVTLVNAKELPQNPQKPTVSGLANVPVLNSEEYSKVEKKFTINDSKLDPKIIAAAQDELRRFLGDPKAELYEVIDTDVSKDWLLPNKNGKGIVGINKQTGQIMWINADYTWNEVAPAVKEAAQKAIHQLDAAKTFTAQTVTKEKKFSGERPTNEWRLEGAGMRAGLDAATLDVIYASVVYPLAQADKKALAAGQNALQVLNGGKPVAFDTATHYYDKGISDIWRFSDNGGLYVAEVGAKTDKVFYTYMYGKRQANEAKLPPILDKDRKPIYTKEQAVAAAKPMLKKVFGIDLTGYTVEFGPENPYFHTFTKKGQPTIQAHVDRTGMFWSYYVIPSNGMRN
ncbi:M56 family metallopeptidase [Aneurinibacillus aneurinilyticus]|uniref:M56 family metallopeptidase n=1 Tax=Aneurinibacillus aneurinilyticus TaxID=1391 RepID=UPI0023F04DE8|nr:M56 family metallopeptidase [Aneurinibacillus aneurinilyticus]